MTLIYIPNTKDELLFIDKNGFTAADQANGRHSQSGQSAEQLLGSNKKHERLQRSRLLQYEGVNDNNVPQFRCTTAKRNKTSPTHTFASALDTTNCWQLQIGIRYFFN